MRIGLVDVGFSTLLDIDKLTLIKALYIDDTVLVLCWILINLHRSAHCYSNGRF